MSFWENYYIADSYDFFIEPVAKYIATHSQFQAVIYISADVIIF
jgi:hypothetical protein